jgi:hypothetical protein
MPEILLLTAISRSGCMAPMARAFSVTEPLTTGTVLNPFSPFDLALL